ncbi:MerR family transcriptional regulator [Occultella glacieicola]|uniref:MerR family transcriptional regulator n=1 Tax=Occultella glacieicola TaxID=2518684 RepID=A0ABY2E6W8_9MICO|nr:MerR family transcriptional regulator [Occultella glacieicola]TDE97294.1 MerR family transcriptional regulator [Occultella glacieicola]
MAAADVGWRVGELADLAGLTVRTLHHYDDIGLLRPERTPAGHRVYLREHVERLYRISVLRRFGTPLEEIGRALDEPGWAIDDALRQHLATLEDEVLRTERLLHRLSDVRAAPVEDGTSQAPDGGGVGDVGVCRRLLSVLEDTAVARTEPLRRIAVLVYDDLARAHEYLVRVFGLEPGPVRRDRAGTVVQAEVRTVDGLVMLHPVAPRWGLASPASLGAATGMLVITVQDVDAHHSGVLARGGTVTYAPTDQPYGVREYGATGPEGEPWSFWTPLAP